MYAEVFTDRVLAMMWQDAIPSGEGVFKVVSMTPLPGSDLVALSLAPFWSSTSAYVEARAVQIVARKTSSPVKGVVTCDPRIRVGCEVHAHEVGSTQTHTLGSGATTNKRLALGVAPLSDNFVAVARAGHQSPLPLEEEIAQEGVRHGFLYRRGERDGDTLWSWTERGLVQCRTLEAASAPQDEDPKAVGGESTGPTAVAGNPVGAEFLKSIFTGLLNAYLTRPPSSADTPEGDAEKRFKLPAQLSAWYDEHAKKRGNDPTSVMREVLFAYAEKQGFGQSRVSFQIVAPGIAGVLAGLLQGFLNSSQAASVFQPTPNDQQPAA